ncbi:MAG: phospho-N-acetylmuramoyl-pentapeptide-transferase [Deltaproteobacteria bacterium RBG_13_52_11]|nr:MAG: phospho-N-acetylmuramoyl-pentapeptide-transferase [Deltaproteobacteria bacterium RBG_13_52_11]
MIYHLFYPLHTTHIAFNVLKYISFRAISATLTALLITFILGPWLIKKLKELQIGQRVREDVPARHRAKEGTPTMGGTLIIIAVIGSTLLWSNLTNLYVWLVLFITSAYALLGFVDDYRKIKRGKGVSGRAKLIFQTTIALVAAGALFTVMGFNHHLTFPFFKYLHPDLGLFYIIFIIFILVGTSNAVNLTDGLDGLAIGPVMITAGTFALVTYLSGHAQFSNYLQIPYTSGCGELSIFCGAIVGAGLGFLWFNTYPAQIFMGDIGSLSLGGALAMVAIIAKQEIFLAIVGGIFVIETLSVIIQVAVYQTKRKRVFKMAPLHHHFELMGWVEPKIIVRFWIVTIILSLIAISTLKLR